MEKIKKGGERKGREGKGGRKAEGEGRGRGKREGDAPITQIPGSAPVVMKHVWLQLFSDTYRYSVC